MFKRLGGLIAGLLLVGSGLVQAQSDWEVIQAQNFEPLFEKITSTQAVEAGFSLSPDQNQLAWLSVENELCVYEFTQERTTCTPLPSAYGPAEPYTRAVWSPDQNSVMLVSNLIYVDQPPSNIWLYSVAEKTFANITQNSGTEELYRAQWNPADSSLYVVSYRQKYVGEQWMTEAQLYHWLPDSGRLEEFLDLTPWTTGSDLTALAIAPDGQRLALLGAGYDADRLPGGLWLIDLREKTVERAAGERDLRAGLPDWYLYTLSPQEIIWNESGLFITLAGFSPFDPIGVVVTYFDPDQKTAAPLFKFDQIIEGDLYDLSHPFPLTGQVTQDGRFFIYAMISDTGVELWMLPLPPDGRLPVLIAESFRLNCGTTYAWVTVQAGKTFTHYLPRFSMGCGE